ncbi:TPA: hypothetical protein DDZ86_01500 [Candidatus Dependentiae bacterium]|nr:MAG: Excinuclease ABC subunit C [candidate division TM6 bacterium GW2011_GWF2_43_87]HBL98299.1 hypothetical protein [Candidatus Dependentiae bacterium]
MTETSTIPHLPGVYVFKDAAGSILYIGKAQDLRKRVASYFQKRDSDGKIAQLLDEHSDIGYIITRNPIEALLLEAHLIQSYQPPYNVLLKNGNPFVYLLFTKPKKGLPTLEIVRTRDRKNPGRYFGPFLQRRDARMVYEFLLRMFKLFICGKKMPNGCLDFHLGRCTGSCREDFDLADYLMRLELAHDVLAGQYDSFISRLKEQIAGHNAKLEFEQAQSLHELLQRFEHLFDVLKTRFSYGRYVPQIENVIQVSPGPEDYLICADELKTLLNLEKNPLTIDCFDISHFQGHGFVGSCVRFTNGIPDKKNFRHFIIKTVPHQDDYAALREIVVRRYRHEEDKPDLVLIDGGKGQLNATASLVFPAPCVSLAKREERLFSAAHPQGTVLSLSSRMGRLLIALRDYAHHFAITFHRKRNR